MSENNEGSNPLSALLGRPGDSADETKKKGKPKTKADEPKEIEVSPPYPVGARLRYSGSRRLFAGWEAEMILAPGFDYTVASVVGPYSVIVAIVAGKKYEMLVSAENRDEWSQVAV
jgi:hypothetical protein